MPFVRNSGISRRLLAVAVVACLAMVGLGVLAALQMRAQRYDDRRAATQAVVQTALGVITHFGALETDGTMTQEEAQKAALGVLAELRYNESDYFWVNSDQAWMIMHPVKPELDGTDVSGMTDPDGVPIFRRFVEVVQADGQGFVNYQWPKPGADAPQPKISFVAGYQQWGWIVGSGVYVDDIEAAVARSAMVLGGEVAGATLLIVLIILLVRRGITRPIAEMTRVLEGNSLGLRLDEGVGRTELDRLSAAVNGILDRVSGVVSGVVDAASSVSTHVMELAEGARGIEAQAARTAEQAESVSTSSREVVAGFDRVAGAIHEIDDAIRSISETVQKVATVAGGAVGATERTTGIVTRLGTSTTEIGEVLQTITAIAEQTNLLALNATIESARAGEAGKGFAVVATEVKELSLETAKATENIAARIETLRADADRSMAAVSEISQVIAQINEYQTGIAAAVEEQSATMANINDSVAKSSRAGAVSGDSITAVATATDDTRRQLDGMTRTIDSLGRISHDLEETVSAFR